MTGRQSAIGTVLSPVLLQTPFLCVLIIFFSKTISRQKIYIFPKAQKRRKSPISITFSPLFLYSWLISVFWAWIEIADKEKNWWLDACPLTRGHSRLQPVSAYVDRLVIRSIAPGIENRESGLLIEIIRNRTPYVCCTTITSSCLRDVVWIYFAPIHRNCI